MWRIDGRINVVSWIDPDGPGAGALQREDAIVSIDGTEVDDLNLEEVKEELRNLCKSGCLVAFSRPQMLAEHMLAPGDALTLTSFTTALDFKARVFRPSKKTTEERTSELDDGLVA